MNVVRLSVAVALLIGALEPLSMLADKPKMTGGISSFASDVDLNAVGYAIVGLSWSPGVLARFARIEERWSAAKAAASRRRRNPRTIAEEGPTDTCCS